MADEQYGPVGGQCLDDGHDLPGGLRVQVRGRLVEQHERRVPQERAGERDPLPLARGQSPGAFGQLAVEAVGQRVDKLRRAGPRGGPPDRGWCGAWFAERDVVSDGTGEQVRALRHPGDLPPPGADRDRPQPGRTDVYPAACRLAKAQQQSEQ